MHNRCNLQIQKIIASDRNERASRQNVVLQERSLDLAKQLPALAPRRAHENDQSSGVQQSGLQNELDSYHNRRPVRYLPPPPTSSSSMWGVPSWQMGTLSWRNPADGGAPSKNI
jgi:hypothetical protein